MFRLQSLSWVTGYLLIITMPAAGTDCTDIFNHYRSSVVYIQVEKTDKITGGDDRKRHRLHCLSGGPRSDEPARHRAGAEHEQSQSHRRHR